MKFYKPLPSPSQHKEDGFTLMELMVVVVIIGVLAAVSMPIFSKYLRKSKTSEAALNLRKIYDGQITYFEQDIVNTAGQLLSKSFVEAGPTPSGIPQPNKRIGDWSTEDWKTLRFGTDGPVFYTYEAEVLGVNENAKFTARAWGDLDGDGITSLFERLATVDSTGSIVGGAALYESFPTE